MTARYELRERRDQAMRDLRDLRHQIDSGEIDVATADRLRARYALEAARAIRALGNDDAAADHVPADGTAGRRRGSRRRLVAGAVLVVAAVAAAAFLLPRALTPRPPGGFVTGNEVAGGRDLSTVTNEELEEVVADNPGVVAMRVALARRYFEAGDYAKALVHYRALLQPGSDLPAEVLRNVGWILFASSDETQAAASYVEESLRRSPDDPLGLWFLAQIRLDGLDDPDGAAELARRLLERDDLGPDEREAVEQLLDRAESRTSGVSP